jgi:hypothetical protein
MPLFDKNQTNQTDTNQTNESTQPNDNFLMAILGQSLPAIFEKFTGQKIQMNGPEIAQALIQIQNGLQTVVNNQQELAQKLVNLEINANSQLTNLTQQFQSLRLTHTWERKKKEIAYSKLPENQEENY